MRWSSLAFVMLLILWCGGCYIPVEPQMELHSVSLEGDRLRIIVDTSTIAVNPLRGDRNQNFHQYLLTYKLAANSDRADFLDSHELPRLRGAPHDGIGPVVLARSGLRAVRARELDTAVVNGKAYSTGKLDLLELDPSTGQWRILRHLTTQSKPFLLSPSATKLVVYDGSPRAIDLQTMFEVPVPGVNETFAAAGESWISEIYLPSYSSDLPDYLGLTDNFDYGSAKGGALYSQTLFERLSGRTIIPGSTRPVGSNALVHIMQVRQAQRESWIFLCATEPQGFAVLDDHYRLVAQLPATSADGLPGMRLTQFQWNPDDGSVVFFKRNERIADGSILVSLWRYGRRSNMIENVRLDLQQHFRESGHRYEPLESGKIKK